DDDDGVFDGGHGRQTSYAAARGGGQTHPREGAGGSLSCSVSREGRPPPVDGSKSGVSWRYLLLADGHSRQSDRPAQLPVVAPAPDPSGARTGTCETVPETVRHESPFRTSPLDDL